MAPEEIEIRPGQVWEDKDTRGGIRQVEVLRIVTRRYGKDLLHPVAEVMGQRHSTVRLERLRKGFILIKDVSA